MTTSTNNQALIEAIDAGEELAGMMEADRGIDAGEWSSQFDTATPESNAIEDAAWEAEVRAFDGQFDEDPWWGN